MISKTTKGLLTILLASAMFGLMALLVKIASAYVGAGQILLMRSLIGFALIVPLIFIRRSAFNVKTIKPLIWRGVSGGIAVSLYFYAITRIPLADASILANAYPIFAVIFSAWYLKEKVGFDTVVALILALFGMGLIIQPRFSSFDSAYFLAIVSAVFAGLAITMVRQLRPTNSSLVVMLSQIFGIFIVAVPITAINFTWPSFLGWQFLLLIGLVSTVSQLIFTIPFKVVTAAEGSIVAINHAAFAVMFAVIFLKEPLSVNFFIGTILIFGSSLYLIWINEK